MATTQPYFAYGSNLYEPRLLARVPAAQLMAVAELPGYRLGFRKRSADGSTKCDLVTFAQATVWGVLYTLDAQAMGVLDAIEGEGYRREEITVATNEAFVDAFTYRARAEWHSDGLPYAWYRDLVVTGARWHLLPEYYTNALAGTEACEDPDTERARANAPDRI